MAVHQSENTSLKLRYKKWGFAVVAVILLAIFIEIAAFVGYWIVAGHRLSLTAVNVAKNKLAAETGSDFADGTNSPRDGADPRVVLDARKEMIHPYLGYTREPKASGKVSPYGFYYRQGLPQRRPHQYNIAVVGGSVALLFARNGFDALKKELAALPFFKGKQIELVNLAISGHKQPQQLFTIIYFHLLGGQFDMVINLDGYNELVLPVCENIPQNVAAIFPRDWYWRVQAIPDFNAKNFIAKIIYFRERRSKWAKKYLKSPLRYLASANLIWKWRDRFFQNEITKNQHRLYFYCRNHKVAIGPQTHYANNAEMYQHLGEIWKKSSLELARFCKAHRIRYFHFLQPNQYVPGSKPISVREKKIAYDERLPSCQCVREGYPVLIAQGKKLAQSIAFADMTMVFADVATPLYFDPYCHFNAQGTQILAKAMARFIRQQWDN